MATRSMRERQGVNYRKSSRSHLEGQECVIVGFNGGEASIGDSKLEDSPLVEVSSTAFGALLGGIKAGRFDR